MQIAYHRSPDLEPAAPAHDLRPVPAASIVASVRAVQIMPQDFLPSDGQLGMLIGFTQAAERHLVRADGRLSACRSPRSSMPIRMCDGAMSRSARAARAPAPIAASSSCMLKPLAERSLSADEVAASCAASSRRYPGINVFIMNPPSHPHRRPHFTRAQLSVHAAGPRPRSSCRAVSTQLVSASSNGDPGFVGVNSDFDAVDAHGRWSRSTATAPRRWA